MSIELCPKCKRLHYLPGDCPSSPRQESTSPAIKVRSASSKKMGRPKTITDMKAYKAEKERARRARLKEKAK